MDMYWTCCGHVADMFVIYFTHILDICWTCFGHVLHMSWICFGYILDMCWICSGYVLDMFWTYFGYVSDMFWKCFGHVLDVMGAKYPYRRSYFVNYLGSTVPPWHVSRINKAIFVTSTVCFGLLGSGIRLLRNSAQGMSVRGSLVASSTNQPQVLECLDLRTL